MAISPGDKLGPYEVLSLLGEGGMGQVWKARDTRLDRIVAIKTSADRFSERFAREARAVASLNHPNICQLYDVGPDYIVMEFVEGSPVSPPDSPRKLLDIAVQISEGLASAHAAGIVHRDLKPDNILITREGRVKILDFGLAKIAQQELSPGDATQQLTAHITDPGTTMGTIAYMSPEQARGQQNLTAQSDQFSLGLVLYELATGKKAFQRGSAAEIMAAIIRDDAPPLPASLPPNFRWIVERLLHKEPNERYDSTRDLHRELRQVRDRLSESVSTAVVPAPSPPSDRKKTWIAAAVLGLIAGLAAGYGWWQILANPAEAKKPLLRAAVGPYNPFVSPDGKWLVGVDNGVSRPLYLRKMDEMDWHRLPGTESAVLPFWASDSSGFGYFVRGQLRKHSIAGGDPGILANVPTPGGGAWRGSLDSGDILYASGGQIHHLKLPSLADRVLPLSLEPGIAATYPVFLPEGDGFVFLAGKPIRFGAIGSAESVEQPILWASSLSATAGEKPRRLADIVKRPAFSRHPVTKVWHMLYPEPNLNSQNLLAVPINPRTGERTGVPKSVTERLADLAALPNLPPWDVSGEGLLFTRDLTARRPIWSPRWYDRSGKLLGATGDPEALASQRLSPDERRVILLSGMRTLTMLDLATSQSRPFSSWPDPIGEPVWSPDASQLYYLLLRRNVDFFEIVRHSTEPGGTTQIVGRAPSGRVSNLQTVTPDGRYLIGVHSSCIYAFDTQAPPGGAAECVVPTGPRFSPPTRAMFLLGGRWLFAIAPSGGGSLIKWPPSKNSSPEIYPLPPTSRGRPFASPDGRELCWFRPVSNLLVCSVVGEAGSGPPVLGREVEYFTATTVTGSTATVGAISRDGKRFLLLTTDIVEPRQTEVVSDWSALLDKK